MCVLFHKYLMNLIEDMILISTILEDLNLCLSMKCLIQIVKKTIEDTLKEAVFIGSLEKMLLGRLINRLHNLIQNLIKWI